MRMITITKTLYNFDDLTEDAQEEAIRDHSYINIGHGWWDTVYEDAKNIHLIIDEFDLNRFTLYANFVKSGIDTVDAILAEHGKETETYKTALLFKERYTARKGETPTDEDPDFSDIDVEFLRAINRCYFYMLKGEWEYLLSREAVIETIRVNEFEFEEDGNLAPYSMAERETGEMFTNDLLTGLHKINKLATVSERNSPNIRMQDIASLSSRLIDRVGKGDER